MDQNGQMPNNQKLNPEIKRYLKVKLNILLIQYSNKIVQHLEAM